MMKFSATARFAVIFFLVAAVSFIRWWFIYDQSLTGIDDANIFFVYASNLAEGYGFVYNPGGETVEGFTSLLWVIILAPLYLLGYMEILILLFNLLIISYTLYRFSGLLDTLNFGLKLSHFYGMGLAAWISLLFILLVPGYVDWTILTLMETGLWSSLLVLSAVTLCELFLKPGNEWLSRHLLILLPLLIFTRPESLAWGLVFIAVRIFQLLYQKLSGRMVIKHSLFLFVAYIIPVLLLFWFRISYFGYPLPNTYYAKMSGTLLENLENGAYYLLRYVKENPFVPIFAGLLALSLFLILKKAWQRKGSISTYDLIQGFIVSVSGIQFLIPLYTGGDHFYLARFMQPLYPVMLLGVFNVKFWAEHGPFKMKNLKPMQSGLALAGAALLILAVTGFSIGKGSPIKKEFDIAEAGRVAGRQLNAMFSKLDEYPSVGTYMAGGIAYTYKGHTIDMLGLNNTLMAHAPKKNEFGVKNHNAFNKEAFFELSPDILHMDFLANLNDARLNETDSSDFQNKIYNFLFQDKTFRQEYEPVVMSTPNPKSWYQAYVNKKYLPVLRSNNQKVYILDRNKNLHQLSSELQLQLSYKRKKYLMD